VTAAFECEVRFLIPDIAAFRARLASLGAHGCERYALTDRYFRPELGEWEARTHALRVREWCEPLRPSELLLTHVETVRAGGLTCKRSLLPQGKLRLHEGSSAECADVCEALGFVLWLEVVKTDCAICDVPGLGKASYEHVAPLGWTSEIEVEGPDPAAAIARIRAALAALAVPLASATDLPMAVLVAERLRQQPASPS
jgi:adenylate cyclase class IV